MGAQIELDGAASLQNNVVLVTDPSGDWRTEMSGQLEVILGVTWDVLELALGEFINADPQFVVDALDYARGVRVVRRAEHRGQLPEPRRQLRKPLRPVPGQTVYYYHLPGFATPRLGQNVHTLSLFDLYRDWATYAHPDFHFQHDYIIQELRTRGGHLFSGVRVLDHRRHRRPAFLPEYLYARWNDIHTLTAEIRRRPGARGPHDVLVRARVGLLAHGLPRRRKCSGRRASRSSLSSSSTTRARSAAAGRTSRAISRRLIEPADAIRLRPTTLPYIQGEDGTIDEGVPLGIRVSPAPHPVRGCAGDGER